MEPVSTPPARNRLPRWVKWTLVVVAVWIVLSVVWLWLNTLGPGNK